MKNNFNIWDTITCKPSKALGAIKLAIKIQVFLKKTHTKRYNFKTNNTCHLDTGILKIISGP